MGRLGECGVASNRLHRFYWRLLHLPVELFMKLKFGYKYKKPKTKELPGTYIVLSNHVTDYDPIFVGMSFRKQMYFVASEHITRWGLASKLLKHCFAPIIRYKGTTAASTVMEMVRKVKDGKSVCMFAEGARSWDGVTAYIQPATGKVIKSAKCALITYRIEGGYFVSPVWSEGGTRKGRVSGNIVNIYTAEQIAEMSVAQINEVIAKDLHVDAYERQLAEPARYKGKHLAVRLESMLFVCPKCGAIDSLFSEKDTVQCTKCDMIFRYNEYAMLEGIEHKTVKDLYARQKDEVKKMASADNFSFSSANGVLKNVTKGEEIVLAQGPVSLSKEKFICGDYEISFGDILDMAMHGRYALVFSSRTGYYELVSEQNVLKYHLLYEFYKTGTLR